MKNGYIQIYTGEGKGKTTAALGLLLRALGAGFNVCFCQFVKNGKYSETAGIKKIAESSFPDKITTRQFGNKRKVSSPFTDKDKKAAEAGFSEVKQFIATGKFDLIILDELNIAIHHHLISKNEVLKMMKTKPQSLEIIITGRYAEEEIIEAADLVTIMGNRKHYINDGVSARRGIEI